MKIKANIISTSCIILILFLIFGKMGFYHYYPDNSYGLGSYTIIENKSDSINSEIRIAQGRLDSIKREKTIYIQGFAAYSGWSGGFVGLVKPLSRENLYRDKETSQEYLKLSKIGLKIQDEQGPNYLAYYSKNESGYISRTKLTTRGKRHTVSYVDKKVNYNYSAEDNTILILVQSSVWKFCIQALIFLTIALFVVAYWFVLRLFIKFLLAISRNNGFEEVNVNRLKLMSIILLILGCINYVISIIIYGIFSLNHPSEGVIITHSFWEHDCFMVILSALCYLIYTAFKKAMILQQEQDLTI